MSLPIPHATAMPILFIATEQLFQTTLLSTRRRDHGNPVISRNWPPDSCGLNALQPLLEVVVWFPHCIARTEGPDGRSPSWSEPFCTDVWREPCWRATTTSSAPHTTGCRWNVACRFVVSGWEQCGCKGPNWHVSLQKTWNHTDPQTKKDTS